MNLTEVGFGNGRPLLLIRDTGVGIAMWTVITIDEPRYKREGHENQTVFTGDKRDRRLDTGLSLLLIFISKGKSMMLTTHTKFMAIKIRDHLRSILVCHPSLNLNSTV